MSTLICLLIIQLLKRVLKNTDTVTCTYNTDTDICTYKTDTDTCTYNADTCT